MKLENLRDVINRNLGQGLIEDSKIYWIDNKGELQEIADIVFQKVNGKPALIVCLTSETVPNIRRSKLFGFDMPRKDH